MTGAQAIEAQRVLLCFAIASADIKTEKLWTLANVVILLIKRAFCSAPICCCISHRLLRTRERGASVCVVATVSRPLLRLCTTDVPICCIIMFKTFIAGE